MSSGSRRRSPSSRTPLVTLLLGLIEDLAERVQKQDEEIAQ
jgi:hypothetical protein